MPRNCLLIGANKDESTLFMLGHPKFGAFDDADLAKHAKATAGDKAAQNSGPV